MENKKKWNWKRSILYLFGGILLILMTIFVSPLSAFFSFTTSISPLGATTITNLNVNITNLDATAQTNITANWYENNQSMIMMYIPFDANQTTVLNYNGVYDVSGLNNNLTVIDKGVVWINGTRCILGGCIKMDGTGSAFGSSLVLGGGLNYTGNEFTNLVVNFTYELWINITANSNSITGLGADPAHTILVGQGQLSNPNLCDVCIELSPKGIRGRVIRTGNLGNNTDYNFTANSNWQHIVMTYSSSAGALAGTTNLTLYINGTMVNTTQTSGNIVYGSQGATLRIIGAGATAGGVLTYLNGTMDELRIWNRTLTPQQIKQNYIAGLNRRSIDVLVSQELTAGWNYSASLVVANITDYSFPINTTQVTVNQSYRLFIINATTGNPQLGTGGKNTTFQFSFEKSGINKTTLVNLLNVTIGGKFANILNLTIPSILNGTNGLNTTFYFLKGNASIVGVMANGMIAMNQTFINSSAVATQSQNLSLGTVAQVGKYYAGEVGTNTGSTTGNGTFYTPNFSIPDGGFQAINGTWRVGVETICSNSGATARAQFIIFKLNRTATGAYQEWNLTATQNAAVGEASSVGAVNATLIDLCAAVAKKSNVNTTVRIPAQFDTGFTNLTGDDRIGVRIVILQTGTTNANVTINYNNTGSFVTVPNITIVLTFNQIPQFWYANNVWNVNVTEPSGLTGLQDLFINASFNTDLNSVASQTQTSAINYGGATNCPDGLTNNNGSTHCATNFTNDEAVGAVAWTNTLNAYDDNGVYSTSVLALGQQSNYLRVNNFTWNIPSGNLITGVQVNVKRKAGLLSDISDTSIRLGKGNVLSSDRSGGGTWNNADNTTQYGGVNDLWGFSSIRTDEINSTNFSFIMSVTASVADTASVDAINMTAFFSPIVTDSCTYTSGNWNVNLPDNCTVSSTINLAGNNLIINGLTGGTFSIQPTGSIINSLYQPIFYTCTSPTNICLVQINQGTLN